MTTNAELLIIGNHGIYIPQLFAQTYGNAVIEKERLADDIKTLLAGPDHEWYDDAWCNVLDWANIKGDNGKTFFLYQHDGDLWAIPEEDRQEYEGMDMC